MDPNMVMGLSLKLLLCTPLPAGVKMKGSEMAATKYKLEIL